MPLQACQKGQQHIDNVPISAVRASQGRLTMADGLWFAQEHGKVEAVIDIATLVRPVVWASCAVAAPAGLSGTSCGGPQSIIPADKLDVELSGAAACASTAHVSCLFELALQFAHEGL